VTAGDDFENLGRFLTDGRTSYSADDVIDYLLGLQFMSQEPAREASFAS
jgi:hypothetical protein